MLKNKLSVQINIEGKGEKCYEVPSFLVKNWKKLLVFSSSLIIGAFTIIIFVATKNTEQDLTSQYAKNLDTINRKNQMLNQSNEETEREILEAKKSFDKIDSTLNIINKKMEKRGLQTIALENAGGPVDSVPNDIELLSSHYMDVLLELDKKLENLPIGTPHNGKVTSKFGYRSNPFTNKGREMHSGIDFKGRTGDLIRSTAKGTVVFSGYEGDYGYVVKVKHANNYETRYAHLTKPLVRKGEKIDAGTTIGLLGNTGRSTGPHLHYEVLKNDKKVNPEKYFTL